MDVRRLGLLDAGGLIKKSPQNLNNSPNNLRLGKNIFAFIWEIKILCLLLSIDNLKRNKMNFRTRIKNLDDQQLVKRTERLCDLSLDLGGSYFKEFMYAVAQMNIRGIKHNYSYEGTKVQ